MSCKLPPENYPRALLKHSWAKKFNMVSDKAMKVCVCVCVATLKRQKTSIHSRGPAPIKQTLANKAMLGGGCTA